MLSHLRILLLAPLFMPILLGPLGCASPQEGSTAQGNAGVNTGAVSEGRRTARQQQPEGLEEVERRYLIGPTAARELGYRIDWQFTGGSQGAKIFEIQHDSVFMLDRRNFLTRLDRSTGSRIWSLPVAEQVLDIQGVTYVPEAEQVFLTAGGVIMLLDAANGSSIGRQRLQRTANTAPVRFGQFFVYGSRTGQAVWHSFVVGHEWRAYQVSRLVRIPPLLAGDFLVVVGTDGRVMALHAPSASMRWDKRLLAPVTAQPAVGANAVYVAGLDQHLWAYDLESGRNLWRYLTDSPLTTSPFVYGQNVYQQVPGTGLVALVARPQDRPGGQVAWTASEVRGNVIAGRQGRLFVWNEQTRRLTLVDERSGGVVGTIDLPNVMEIRVIGENAEELYAFGEGGRVIRLLAR